MLSKLAAMGAFLQLIGISSLIKASYPQMRRAIPSNDTPLAQLGYRSIIHTSNAVD